MGCPVMLVTLLMVDIVGVGTNDILDNQNVRQTLELFCPDVDICNPDLLDSRLGFNTIDEDGQVSGCHGCSCHKDCKLSSNCCFPDDGTDVNTTSTLTNDEGTIVYPTMQCMFLQIGVHRYGVDVAVPSYRTVTEPPAGRCKREAVCPGLSGQTIQPSCDSSPAAPWGELLPVHSTETGTIYKNEMCACCHGATLLEYWTPVLSCRMISTDKKRLVPFAEHFSFLLNSKYMSQNCFITFDHSDALTLFNNRCYLDTIDVCPPSAYQSFRVPDGVNLNRSEFIAACDSGPHAPVKLKRAEKKTYKNIFCLFCNKRFSLDPLRFTINFGMTADKDPGRFSNIYMLDTNAIVTLASGKQKIRRDPVSMACLRSSQGWVEESCRAIDCPFAQRRDEHGVCVHLSRWSARRNHVIIKLKYTNKNESILTMLNDSDATNNQVEFSNAVRKSLTWSGNWQVKAIFHTVRMNDSEPLVAVVLLTETFGEKLTSSLKASLERRWTIELNGHNISFEQSFLEYSLKPTSVEGFYKPLWAAIRAESSEAPNSVRNIDHTLWKLVYLWSHFYRTLLSKLILCEQVALFEGEYEMLADGLLMNKLTNRTMYDMEFNLVEEGSGPFVPGVCLHDTPLLRYVDSAGRARIPILVPSLILLTLGLL